MPLRLDDLDRLEAGPAEAVGDELSRLPDVQRISGIGADARDRAERLQLLDIGVEVRRQVLFDVVHLPPSTLRTCPDIQPA